ncbi:trehalose-phosphatase [Candidatus Omnitrophota bacterium]
MKYLFNDWNKVSLKIKKAPHVFLFFDYDGTLTPIVSRPGLAKFPRATKSLIKKLGKDPRFTVAIISGRSLKNIKKMVGLKGIVYAGNHGMEIEASGVKFLRPSAIDSARPIIKKIRSSLRKELGHVKGVIVEDKLATLSVHYRLAKPSHISTIKGRFNKMVKSYIGPGKIKITSGKKVLEVRPSLAWDKGKAVTWLLKRKKTAFSLYAGDDVTDVDAFRAIKSKGISIFVGRPKKTTMADYFLKDPKDIGKLIERLGVL